MSTDFYADGTDTAEGKVFTVTGQDWDEIAADMGEGDAAERIVVNMARSTRRRTACSG